MSDPEVEDQSLEEPARPRRRSECQNGPRPCPWVSCRWHLMLDVDHRTGQITTRFDDVEDMPETCALDVADRGPALLSDIADFTGVSKSRVGQVLLRGLLRLGLELGAETPADLIVDSD